MKTYAVFMFIALTSISNAQSPDKVYVCSPCGYECDLKEYKTMGSCSSCGMTYVEKKTVNFDNITFAQMCERVMKNKGILLLDVRSDGEFTGESTSVNSFGHIKGAVNINVTDLPSRLEELAPYKDKEIIVYCSHSHRSPRAAYMLTTNGFRNVSNVSGGVSILERDFGENSCLTEIFVRH
ncbi:MAG TPA: hypothetical protein DIS90_01740 [Cytophagales bacterium]|nr:hypothetical protein [Cytophagales bacterium]